MGIVVAGPLVLVASVGLGTGWLSPCARPAAHRCRSAWGSSRPALQLNMI